MRARSGSSSVSFRCRSHQHQVRIPVHGLRLGHAPEVDAGAKFSFAGFVDTAVANRPPQPPRRMRGAVDAVELAIHTEKNVLRKLSRRLAIAEKTHRQTEDQRLVVFDDPGEIKTHVYYYG